VPEQNNRIDIGAIIIVLLMVPLSMMGIVVLLFGLWICMQAIKTVANFF